MSLKQKLDSLDFTLNILREHERSLDILEQRLGSLVRDLDQRVSSRVQSLDIVTLIDLFEYKAFETSSFSFYQESDNKGNYVLIDNIYDRRLVFGESEENLDTRFWFVSVFHGVETRVKNSTEHHYFDSERMMLAWIVRYMNRYWRQSKPT